MPCKALNLLSSNISKYVINYLCKNIHNPKQTVRLNSKIKKKTIRGDLFSSNHLDKAFDWDFAFFTVKFYGMAVTK